MLILIAGSFLLFFFFLDFYDPFHVLCEERVKVTFA